MTQGRVGWGLYALTVLQEDAHGPPAACSPGTAAISLQGSQLPCFPENKTQPDHQFQCVFWSKN